MHYYKRNIGDYHKKAGRLTMLQHGAYTLLMDSCYDREEFPTMDQAIEWLWASTDEEIAAVRFVLGRFFELEDGVYVQHRIAEEIGKYRKNAETNARIAREREAKRKEKSTKRARSVDEPETDGDKAPPNQEPITTNQEPITKDPLVPDSPKPEKHSAEDLSCAKWIYDRILMLNPGHKKPNLEKWANTIRLMRERDKRTHREICELFKWANDDQFWQTNILGPDKLRKQWDKLTLARNRNGKVNSGTGGGGVDAAMQRSAAAFKAKLESGGVDLGEDDQHLRGEMDQGAWGNSESNVVDGDFEVIPDRD